MISEFGSNVINGASKEDQSYFESYSDVSVHELMLKDVPRTLAYKNFIERNQHLIKGKVVLDIGAGSGILSLFAAKTGADKVYAVEASSISDTCSEIVKINGYEGKIKVIKNVMEKVELPEKVDVIISEWMGFYLLHESMLDTLIHARDKWLKTDGILLPSHATLYCTPVNMSEYYKENFEFWKDVYGFDFSPFLTHSVQRAFTQPAVTIVKPEQCLSDPQVVTELDLKTASLWDIQDVEKKLKYEIKTDSVLHGFATWFDVKFAPHISNKGQCEILNGLCSVPKENLNGNIYTESNNTVENNVETESSDIESGINAINEVTLSTSPDSSPTHWKQTVCFIPASVTIKKGEVIYCKLSFSQDDFNKRHYNMSLEMLDSLDSEDESDGDDEFDDEEDEDVSEHPVPCDCGVSRCKLIKAIVERYDAEQSQLEMEAEFVDVKAEIQAAQTLDDDSSCLDSECLSESINNDDSYSKEL